MAEELTGEPMVGFGGKQAWLAVRDADAALTSALLGLRDLGPVSWRTGMDLAYFTDDRVMLTPPLPGHGTAAPAGASLAAWADLLAADIPDGAALGGWSLGALLALEIARRHPGKASRLLLIGATPRFVAAPDWPHGLASETVAAFRAGYAADPAATLKRFLALQCLGDARRKTVLARLAATLAPRAASGGLDEGLALLAGTDLRGGLE